MFDSTTAGLFYAAQGAQAAAEAVRDSLGSGTLTVTVTNGETTHLSATFAGPMTAGEDGSLSVDAALSGAVLASGTPNAATWVCRISNASGRYVEGTFGPGGRFTWSRPTMAVGQVARLNIRIGGAEPEPEPLAFSGVPSPIQIEQGGTYDLSQHVTGGTPPYSGYAVDSGSLPSGVSINSSTGVLTATEEASVGESGDITFGVDDSEEEPDPEPDPDPDPPEPGDLPTFGITSAVGGSDLPFAFGHVFAKGDVPAGKYIDSDLTDWQAVPTTFWPDGSVRHAIIAGRATCTASVLKSITLGTSDTDRSGTALTESDLSSALASIGGDHTLTGGAETINWSALVGTGALHRTVCAGPVMSNWIYRAAVPNSSYLVAWFDVRFYKGGTVELFAWVENGCVLSTGVPNDERTWTLKLGGQTVFSDELDIKHHTRIPLLDNAESSFKHWSYWSSDPQIEPRHDTGYMMATGLVPNYGWREPTSGAYSWMVTQAYSPSWIGDGASAMDDVGFQPRIGVHPNNMALYLSSGADPRAYRTMMANGFAGGSWSIHARDTTNDPPAFSDQPTLYMSSLIGGSAGTGGTNGNITAAAAHEPQYAMVPWLVSARWWFLDEAVMWVVANYLWQNPSNRGNANGVYLSHTNNETRGAGWAILRLAQAAAIVPDDHPCHDDLLASLDANINHYHGRYIAGTTGSGAWVNNLGILGHYSSGGGSLYGTPGGVSAWFLAPWMEAYLSLAFGELKSYDLELEEGAKLDAVVAHAAKLPVGLFGDGSAGNFNWRRASAYNLPVGTDSSGWPPDSWYSNFGQVYAAYCQAHSLNDEASAAPGLAFFDNESESATPSDGSDFTTSFLGMNLCALMYAVEHGAPGAAEALARVEASSSWALADAYNDLPVWGIRPRTS